MVSRAEQSRLKAAFGYVSVEQARAYKLPFQPWQRILFTASSMDFSIRKGVIWRIRSPGNIVVPPDEKF